MIGARFTLPTVMWFAILLTCSGLLYSASAAVSGAWHVVYRALFVVFLIGAALCLVTVRGGSLRQWMARRWHVRDKLKDSWIVNAKNKAMVWDGKSASMFIEVFGNPWELSSIKSDGTSTVRKIPLQDIRKELRQFDITVNHVRIIEYGYKAAVHDRAASAVLGAMGTVGHLLGGRTIVEVSIDLKGNLNPVYARRKDLDTVADGLTRTVNIATERVLRTINSHNINARILSSTGVLAVQKDIMGGVGRATDRNEWNYAGVPGDASIGTVVSFVPSQTSWHDTSQVQWGEVLVHRQYNCLTLTPDGGRDVAEFSMAYLTDDPGTLHLLTSQGLFRENGRHLSRISNVLPVSRDMFRDSGNVRVMERDTPTGLEMPVHPLGVYLGVNAESRERVYMGIARGGSPLWVVGDEEFARRIVLRLSTQRYRVAVSVPGKGWEHLVSSRKSRTLAKTSSPRLAAASSDVIVCTSGQVDELDITSDSPSVIVVSDTRPPIDPDAIIETDGTNVYVRVGKVKKILVKDSPPAERPWLEIPA